MNHDARVGGPGDGTGPLGIQGLESLDEIDAVVENVSDDYITNRLHDVLADALMAGLPSLEGGRQERPELFVWPSDVDRTEIQDLTRILEAMRSRLRGVEAETRNAMHRRQQALFSLVKAEKRLAEAQGRVLKTDPRERAYLAQTHERARKILDEAHATAKQILSDARAAAEEILAERCGQAIGVVEGRPGAVEG